MLSTESGVAYRRKAFRAEHRIKYAHATETPLSLFLFLERVTPGGWGAEPFLSLGAITDKLQDADSEQSAFSILFPNPWIRIAPETWPFRIHDAGNNALDLEVWPSTARHDEARWLRSREKGKPLATFVMSLEPGGDLRILLEYHVTLHEQSSHEDAAADRCLAHRLFHRQWEEDMAEIFSQKPNDEGLAMCALRRTQFIHSPVYMPGLSLKEKVRFVGRILETRPGICDREPVAANAERMLGTA